VAGEERIASHPAVVHAEHGQTAHSQHGHAEPELQFHELLRILHRRRWLVLAIALGGTIVASAVAMAIPAKYTAKAQILVESEHSLAPGEARSPPADESAVDTQATMLASRAHLQRVLDSFAGDRRTARRIPRSFDELERHLNIGQERRSRVVAVRYTAADPDAAALVANRVVQLYIDDQTLPQRTYAAAELTRLDARIEEIKKRLAEAGAALRQAVGQQKADGPEGARLPDLARQAAADEQLYQSLVQRRTELRRLGETLGSDVRILSLASPPERPSSPSPILLIAPALVVFGIAGSFLAVLRERLDGRFRTERDVAKALGIPCIGLVPRLRRAAKRRPYAHVRTEPFGPYAEAIRSLAAATNLAAPASTSKVVLVTASLPGEGRTTLAASLATYMTLIGRRVLLMDFDFRHPSALGKANGTLRKDSDLLVRNRYAGIKVLELGFDFLPMSNCTADPVELFASGDLQEIIRGLGGTYDCVIIDGPPLLAAAEARLLATIADQVLLAIKWDTTKREFVCRALDLLRLPGSHGGNCVAITSAVVTQADLGRAGRQKTRPPARNPRFLEPSAAATSAPQPAAGPQAIVRQENRRQTART
jgi:Mrp family chromosome partitioning ATPase/capsular polysaccharide biosynthesis protein